MFILITTALFIWTIVLDIAAYSVSDQTDSNMYRSLSISVIAVMAYLALIIIALNSA